MYFYIICSVIIILILAVLILKKKKNNKNVEKFKDKKILPTFSYKESDNIKIDINLDLIYLDPKYDITNIELSNPKKNNFNWENTFLDTICPSKCQCLTDNNNTICGSYEGTMIYQCPATCPKCNKCHYNTNSIKLNYKDFCNKSTTFNEKERCKLYKKRIVHSKKKCFYTNIDFVDKKFIKKKELCKIFKILNYNGFLVGQDIFFCLSINYLNKKLKNKVESVLINNSIFDNKNINLNIFYSDKNEIYFFINAKDKNKGLSKIVQIDGIIQFKKNTIQPIKFSVKNIVNILSTEDKDKEPKELLSELNLEYNEKKIESSDFDKFSENYLGENKYYACQLANNYSVKNPITKLDNGVYKREKIIDNPTSWKNRADINRPWDY